MFFSTAYDSPVGRLTIACDGENIVGLWIEGQKYFAASVREAMIPVRDHPVTAKACLWLDRYFGGGRPGPEELPLAPAGSAFRQEVWKLLCRIPYGEVTTYGEIAKKIALRRGTETMSARAVGAAVGHNPISIIIPCHRVIGSNGGLTGYAGGLEVKQKLLALEGHHFDALNGV